MTKFFKRLGRKVHGAIRDIERTTNQTVDAVERTANQTVNAVERTANQTVNAVDDFAQKLIHGRNSFSPSAKRFLSLHGDKKIIRLGLNRDPVPAPVQGILDTFGGKIPYHKLFHLRLNCYLEDGTQCLLEKNEVLNFAVGIPPTLSGGEHIPIADNPNATVNEMLKNTHDMMGDRFYSYSVTNNCQDFISAVLRSNGISNQIYLDFVKQDASNLFKGKKGLRQFANTLTDIAGRADIVMQGGLICGDGIGDDAMPNHMRSRRRGHPRPTKTYGIRPLDSDEIIVRTI
jgi:hypothetical protein